LRRIIVSQIDVALEGVAACIATPGQRCTIGTNELSALGSEQRLATRRAIPKSHEACICYKTRASRHRRIPRSPHRVPM
jgi:hypothetical protein